MAVAKGEHGLKDSEFPPSQAAGTGTVTGSLSVRTVMNRIRVISDLTHLAAPWRIESATSCSSAAYPGPLSVPDAWYY